MEDMSMEIGPFPVEFKHKTARQTWSLSIVSMKCGWLC